MKQIAAPRFDHLRRLTDSQGLLRVARGDIPDRFSGYDTIDNAVALRLCAVGSETVDSDLSHLLARTYFGFLSRGRRYDSGVRHHCDSVGGWTNSGDDAQVQSFVARALSAVIVSELPINLRLSAADWWRMLLDEHAPHAYDPISAANWLIAIGHLRAADPGRDPERVESLAHALLDDFYYPTRQSDWEWHESEWTQLSASVPTGLWHAYNVLGERRIFRVAQAMTQFVVDNLFTGDMLNPVGSMGGWQRGGAKSQYNQLPAEAWSIVELLCTAEKISGNSGYGEYAEVAARWFDGANCRKQVMIEASSGGCYDALTPNGVDRNQGASASLAYLLTHAALASRPLHLTEPSINYPLQVDVADLTYSDPSIGS